MYNGGRSCVNHVYMAAVGYLIDTLITSNTRIYSYQEVQYFKYNSALLHIGNKLYNLL